MKNIKVNMHQIRNDVNQGFNYPQEQQELTDSNGNINITCNECSGNFDINPNDCDCDDKQVTVIDDYDDNFDTIANDCDCNIENNSDEVVVNECDIMANNIDRLKNNNDDITNDKITRTIDFNSTPISKIDDKNTNESNNKLNTKFIDENISENNLVMTCYEKHCETMEYYDNDLACENKLYKKCTCSCKMVKEYKQ